MAAAVAFGAAETVEPTRVESVKLFDAKCRALLHVSAEEFLSAMDAGQYPDSWDESSICELEMLLPLAR